MRRIKTIFLSLSLFFVLPVLPLPAAAQQAPKPAQTPAQTPRDGDNPLYKITINVVERQATAINYRHRSGSTPIDFKGTPLLPEARGEARVESKQGYLEIDAEFDKLQPATRYGPEYLTYVMWAISPEGRAINLGEVILNGEKSKLDVTSDLQAFGLIVTAEPYFAVTQPSDVVVMENFVRDDTRGLIEQIDAKYELLQRGQYTTNVLPADLKPIQLDKKTPLDLYEAQNAIRIARWTGADKYAADSFAKAEGYLKQAENYQVRKQSKPASMMARQAVQTAEDTRLISLKREDENRLAQEQAAAAAREADERAKAERAKANADESQLLRAQEALKAAAADAARETAEANTARVAAQAQLDTQRAQNDKRAAEADAERARQSAAKLRQGLIDQFNSILQTRDSDRGLIVNMSDVVFDSGQATLRPVAREKLAKISGIVLSHPGLKIEVEGYTDSTGTEEFNQKLSEGRASAVRDFLMSQGVNGSMITARGLGQVQPVASNDTASGRQLNRRVEMVVSGDIIGTPLGLTSSLNNN